MLAKLWLTIIQWQRLRLNQSILSIKYIHICIPIGAACASFYNQFDRCMHASPFRTMFLILAVLAHLYNHGGCIRNISSLSIVSNLTRYFQSLAKRLIHSSLLYSHQSTTICSSGNSPPPAALLAFLISHSNSFKLLISLPTNNPPMRPSMTPALKPSVEMSMRMKET